VLHNVDPGKVLHHLDLDGLRDDAQSAVHHVGCLLISLPASVALGEGLVQTVNVARVGGAVLEGDHAAVVLVEDLHGLGVVVVGLHGDELVVVVHLDVLWDPVTLLGAAVRAPPLPVLHAVDEAGSSQSQQKHEDEAEAGTAGNAASLPLATLLCSDDAAQRAVPVHRLKHGGAVLLLGQGVLALNCRRLLVQINLRGSHDCFVENRL